MKINLNRQTLLVWDAEAQSLIEQARGHFQSILVMGKINNFYKDNGAHIITSKQNKEKLLKEFIEIEENGMFKTEMVEGQPTLVLKEKIRKKEFEDKMTALMNEEVAIEI